MAVYLAHDDYDAIKEENYISVTSLLKPLKAIILGMRADYSEPDVLDFVASRTGTAIHNAAENAWLHHNYKKNMKKLGYHQDVIDRVQVNPNIVSMDTDDINIFLEKRSITSIGGYRVGGKFDAVFDGFIRDIKTVKAFSFMKNDNSDYQLQMSIYKWLNPDIITGDIGFIDMLITDWKQFEADAKPEYPQLPVVEKAIPLLSHQQTEKWLKDRLNHITILKDKDQSALPECTPQELWQSDPSYAYFKKPAAKRATKVFSSMAEANQRLLDDGSTGKVDTRYGKAKRCTYCNAQSLCNQAARLSAEGLL